VLLIEPFEKSLPRAGIANLGSPLHCLGWMVGPHQVADGLIHPAEAIRQLERIGSARRSNATFS
jgi:hypothetical protein